MSNTLGQTLKEELALLAVDRFKVCVILTIDSKVISAISNHGLVLHTIRNHFAICMNSLHQKMKEEFAFRYMFKYM